MAGAMEAEPPVPPPEEVPVDVADVAEGGGAEGGGGGAGAGGDADVLAPLHEEAVRERRSNSKPARTSHALLTPTCTAHILCPAHAPLPCAHHVHCSRPRALRTSRALLTSMHCSRPVLGPLAGSGSPDHARGRDGAHVS